MHLLEIANPKDHEEGRTEIFVTLSTVTQGPSVDFVVDYSGHIVNQNHNIAIQGSELITETVNGDKTKESVNLSTSHGWVKDNCLSILRTRVRAKFDEIIPAPATPKHLRSKSAILLMALISCSIS